MEYLRRLDQNSPCIRRTNDRFTSPSYCGNRKMTCSPNFFQCKENISSPSQVPKQEMMRHYATPKENKIGINQFNHYIMPSSPQFKTPRKFRNDALVRDNDGMRNFPNEPIQKFFLSGMLQDFYLSPIDWSSKGIISIVLENTLMFFNSRTMNFVEPNDQLFGITNTKFSPDGRVIYIGCNDGKSELFDMNQNCSIHSFGGYNDSILVSDWNENVIIIGGRNGQLSFLDIRTYDSFITEAHEDAIISAKFGYDNRYIATSGTDSLVKIWDIRSNQEPMLTFAEHKACVKALSWNPVNTDLIATGGGLADREIRIWNASTGETIWNVQTGAQVCNLFWNGEYNEIVSAHGYSTNQLSIWNADGLTEKHTFHPHNNRVLFMCPSPDGSSIMTAAPQDSFQIWRLFPGRKSSFSSCFIKIR